MDRLCERALAFCLFPFVSWRLCVRFLVRMSRLDNNVIPPRFFTLEVSWLEFNQRVLDQALDPKTPLLERVKFFCICSSNLDEFFEVRVGGLKQHIESEVVERSNDGLTASETFRAVTRRVRRMVEDQYRCWREDLLPGLAEAGIKFQRFADLPPANRSF